jgi:chromosome segregation ATPase
MAEINILEKIESMKPFIESINAKIAEVENVREEYYNKINNQFDLINNTIQKILQSPKFQAKQEEINRLNEEIQRLNNKISSNEEEIKALNATILQLQNEIDKLKQENASQNASQKEQYEKDKESLVNQIEQLQNENVELKRQIQGLNSERKQISDALDAIIELLKTKVLEMDRLKNVDNVAINTKIQAITNGVDQIFRKLEGDEKQNNQISSASKGNVVPNRNLDEQFEITDYYGSKMPVSRNKLINDLNTKIGKGPNDQTKEKYREALNKIKDPNTTVEEIQKIMKNIMYKNGSIFGGNKKKQRKTKKKYKHNRGMKGRKNSRKLVGGWIYKSTKNLDDKSYQIRSSKSTRSNSSKRKRGNGRRTQKYQR